MPVPADRSDDAYFAPLHDLDADHPRIFLGLVHETDGLDGSRARAAAAKRVLPAFGVSTECGWGRRAAWKVPQLITLHREVVDGLS